MHERHVQGQDPGHVLRVGARGRRWWGAGTDQRACTAPMESRCPLTTCAWGRAETPAAGLIRVFIAGNGFRELPPEHADACHRAPRDACARRSAATFDSSFSHVANTQPEPHTLHCFAILGLPRFLPLPCPLRLAPPSPRSDQSCAVQL